MIYYLVAYLLPAFVMAVSIPLVLNAVPPNGLYGFRTPKTMSSPGVWYPANRRSGWYMIAASLLTICFNLALWATHPGWPQSRLIMWMVGAIVVSVIAGVAASFLYLRRL